MHSRTGATYHKIACQEFCGFGGFCDLQCLATYWPNAPEGPGKLTPYRDQAIRAEVRRELDIAKARYSGRDFEVLCAEGGWSDTCSDRQPLR